MKHFVGALLLALCSCALIACYPSVTRQPICNELQAIELRAHLGKPLPLKSDLEREIQGAYQPDELNYLPLVNPNMSQLPADLSVRWKVNGRRYVLNSEQGESNWATLIYEMRGSPTLRTVVECLGAPSDYWAWYGQVPQGSGWQTTVVLLYPEQGIAVLAYDGRIRSTNEDGSLRNVAMLASSPSAALVYALPTTSYDLVERAYSLDETGVSEAKRHLYLDNIRPWPGNWKAIDVLRTPLPW